MIKVQALTHCEHCNNEAYLPIGDAEDCQVGKYTCYTPAPMCEGSGNIPIVFSLTMMVDGGSREFLKKVNIQYQDT